MVVTSSWNDLDDDNYKDGSDNKQNANWQCSWLNVYDYSSGWSRTFNRVLDDEQNETAQGRLRFAGSSIGNVLTSTGNVDYPEIVTAGWVDQSSGDGCNIDEGTIGVYVLHYTGSGYTTLMNQQNIGVSGFTNGGVYDSDKIQDPVAVVAFAANGAGYADYIFIEGDVYAYNGTDQTLTFQGRDNYFNDDDDGVGGYIISNASVQQAIAGNFDGNKDGREQVIFTTVLKQKAVSKYFYRTWTYSYNSVKENPSVSSTDGGIGAPSNTACSGWDYYHSSDVAVSLAAADMGEMDGTRAKIKSKSLDYTQPEVIAILEAPPYFAEINGGEIGNSTTEYGTSTGTGSGSSESATVTAGVMVGFEYTDPISESGGGFELNISNEWTSETTETTTTTYTITYSNNTGENAVLVYRAPVTVYQYTLEDNRKGSTETSTMTIGIQGQPSSNMVTMDEYNAAAASFDMEQITDAMVGEAGNPQSYRETLPNSTDEHSWQAPDRNAYSTKGDITQELEESTDTEKNSTYNFSAELSAFGSACGVKAGLSVGGGYGTGDISIDSSGITKTATVSGRPSVDNAENYDFNWRLAT